MALGFLNPQFNLVYLELVSSQTTGPYVTSGQISLFVGWVNERNCQVETKKRKKERKIALGLSKQNLLCRKMRMFGGLVYSFTSRKRRHLLNDVSLIPFLVSLRSLRHEHLSVRSLFRNMSPVTFINWEVWSPNFPCSVGSRVRSCF